MEKTGDQEERQVLQAGQSGEWRTAGFACHCEEQNDAAISIEVRNWPEIASPRLREGRNDNEIQADTGPSPVHPIALFSRSHL